MRRGFMSVSINESWTNGGRVLFGLLLPRLSFIVMRLPEASGSGMVLPDGAVVMVTFQDPTDARPAREKQRIQLPLVRTDEPGSVTLTNERIAEILDQEDA